MKILKSLFDYYKSKRPNSEVIEINHPKLNYETVYKNKKLTFNVCPFIVVSTMKTDYDGRTYQDLVLYDSTGEGPVYQDRNYGTPVTPESWFNKSYADVSEIRFRISYLQANYLED